MTNTATNLSSSRVERQPVCADRAPLTQEAISELLKRYNVELPELGTDFALSDNQRIMLQATQCTLPVGTIVRPVSGVINGELNSSDSAVLIRRPGAPRSAEISVCGAKDFLFDTQIEVTVPGQAPKITTGATLAVLSMTDSPVHHHGVTTEIYRIESGSGLLVLNESVYEVGAGDEILLLPGVEHGVMSFSQEVPLVATLTFMPGLAKRGDPLRDEQIDCPRTSYRIAQLAGGSSGQSLSMPRVPIN